MFTPNLSPSTTCLSLPTEGQHQTWSQLYGSAIPLAIAELMQATERVGVVVMPHAAAALRMHQALSVFFASTPEVELFFFPDWETLPYDRFSPYQDLISERLLVLNRLLHAKRLLVVSTIGTLMQRASPPAFLMERIWLLKVGQKMDLHRLRVMLESVGYRACTQVFEHGEFSVRGSLIDVFPMGSTLPFRIELFDDEVEGLSTFDPETQRRLTPSESLHFFPAKEFPTDEAAIARFRKQYRECFPGHATQSPLYEAVSKGCLPGGIEYYFPLFFDETATFFSYLPRDPRVFLMEGVEAAATQFWLEIQARYEEYRHDVSRPLLPPEQLYLDPETCCAALRGLPSIVVSEQTKKGYALQTSPAPLLIIDRQATQPLQALLSYLKARAAWRVLFVVESVGRREILLGLLKQAGIFPTVQSSWAAFLSDHVPLSMIVAPLDEGVELIQANIAMIVESQLFMNQAQVVQRHRSTKVVDPDHIIRDLVELQTGAAVVHMAHGVGRYLGLKTLDVQGVQQDFMELLYAQGDKIYVPVTALQQVSRYTGGQSEDPPLNRLGTNLWQKEKKKATEKIHDLAIELLDLYAKRKLQVGAALQVDESEYVRFTNEFPFVETPDQTRVIQEILTDLQHHSAMERLVCGDVGFGKTEVAMRAAFVAVQNHKQVCVLVPTTLLASQHFETFCDRFATFPIQICLFSRFQQAKECSKIIDGVKNGTVDIIIGTHKLLNQSVPFKSLGLLIIDEEHRFGVKQKEKIKTLRQNVHCLTMTATPIPRTLNMAMSGLRDVSLIATPPAKRLAIKTFWQEKHNALIREAVLREIFRGGQVFYVHNDVASIDKVTQDLQTLVPEATIRFAHGQMPERTLERIMLDFYHQRFHMLVCTTIIETGIDIPSANTIMIDRADLFGLAQLHQLRGRVGRSHHQAYAYLFTPPEKQLTSDAVKRLEAIVAAEALGSGLILATQDLEIRGAGALLGDEQSGNMHAIGFTLYMELLERAVQALREGREPILSASFSKGPEIDVYFSALLPESYVSDVHERLILYKRISNADHEQALETLEVELIDRFGLLPQAAKQLFEVTRLKLFAQSLGIERVQLAKGEGKLLFSEQPAINPTKLIDLIQRLPQTYRLQGSKSLRFQFPTDSIAIAIQTTMQLLADLSR